MLFTIGINVLNLENSYERIGRIFYALLVWIHNDFFLMILAVFRDHIINTRVCKKTKNNLNKSSNFFSGNLN